MNKSKEATEYPGQDPVSKAAVAKQVAEAKAVGDKVRASKSTKGTLPQTKADAKKAERVTKTAPKPDADEVIEALQVEADAEAAAEAVEVEAEAAAPKGRTEITISLRDRDRIMTDDSSAPKAVKTIVATGIEVRRSNGAERPESIPAILPQYYSRWALRLSVTAKQAESVLEWIDAEPVEVGEAKPRSTKSGGGMDEAEKAALIEAQELVKTVDAMPAPEAVKIAATDEFQSAIELVGKAAMAAPRAN